MKPSVVGRLSVLAGSLLLVAACGSDAGTGGSFTRPDSTADDGDTGNGQDTDPGDQGSGDQTPPDLGPPDEGNADEGTDDGTDVLGDPVSDVGPECLIDTSLRAIPSEYLEDDGLTTRPVRLIIEAVDFVNDIVFIRNVTNLIGTNETIDFSDDWRIAHNTSGASLVGARDLPPGGRMRIHLRRSGFNRATDTYLNLGGGAFNLVACGGEIVIQDRTGQSNLEWSNRPGNIEAFVRWGTRLIFSSATATFNDEAFDANAWLVDYTAPNAAVPVCWGSDEGVSWCSAQPTCTGMANDQAIIAIGDVRDPEDWYSAPAAEFVGCP
jgi:hypothetical protein